VIGGGSVKEGVGIVKALSRRDEMKVARHEMAGNRAQRGPSRRVRYDRLSKASYRLARWTTPAAPDHTVPYGTDHIRRVSRHLMPGYHRLVPTGQIQARPFVEVREQSEGTRSRTAVSQYSNTPRHRNREQPVRRSPSSIAPTAQIGLASEARSTTGTLAKSEGRRRGRVRIAR
jgi:hypothetical protein